MRSGVLRVVPLWPFLLLALVLTLAAALEEHNEAPALAGDSDFRFQKQFLDTATLNLDEQDEDVTSPYLDRRDLYMYKLLRSLQSGERRPAVPYWINWSRNDMSQNNEVLEDRPNESLSMSRPGVAVIKRFQGTFGSSKAKAKYPLVRPQQKWKIKKGKGTPMVCYFKLCTFRSPA